MDKRNRRWNERCKRLFLMIVVVFLLFLPLTVYAAETKILSTMVYDGSIYVYIRGVSELQSDSVVQIGNTICQSGQVSSASFSDSGVSMRTLILIDNSKSISDINHTDIQEILEGIISSSMENEQFKIGTFSNQVTYLCDYSSNKEILSNVVKTITYNNQDTYLSDVLHNVIAELQSENVCAYTRIFIIADGADDNPKGWPSDEVRGYIGESGYPIYTLGIPGENNSAELETLFSFSRASDSEYFLLDGSISNEDIVNAMMQDQSGICLKISPDESLKDGSKKSILLKLSTPEGVMELKTSVDMPFGSGVSAQPDDEEPEDDKDLEDDETENSLPVLIPGGETEKVAAEESKTVPWILIVIVAIIVLLSVGVVVVFMLIKRKKKKSLKEEQDLSSKNGDSNNDGHSEDTAMAGDMDTVMIGGTKNDDARQIWSKYNAYLVLKRLDDTNVMFKEPITDVLRIGRFKDQDIVIDDDELSRRHCEIRLGGDLLYIKDCNSLNGTEYEGVAVYDKEKPMVSGGKIKIGAHSYRVELVKEQLGDRD